MNIVFLKLYITDDIDDRFYNSQELGLARALTARHPEHRVDIVLLSYGCREKKTMQLSDRIAIHIFPGQGIGHHGRINPKILKDLQTDLVHLLADNMRYAPEIIAYCRKNRIGCHLYIGTLFTDSRKWYKRMAGNLMMRRNLRAYKTVPVYAKTPAVQAQCRAHGIDAKLAPVGVGMEETVPSERSVEEIRTEFQLPADRRILLFVGRLESYKHPSDALELLLRMEEQYHLLIVGDGSLRAELEQRIREGQLENRVSMIPRIPNARMKELYKACNVFVNLNPDEIYGMAILEAMCHGCPVFARNAPGPAFLLEDGVSGFLCGSVEEMAGRIASFDSNAEARYSVSGNARQRVLDHFVWDRIVDSFEDIR